MVVKKHTLKTLISLDASYTSALTSPSPEHAVFFSKLAILEYCGWIEEVFDQIIRRSVKGQLNTQEFKQMLETSIIGNTHGFQYKKHFRKMLTSAVGLRKAEIIEKYLKDSGQFDILVSELENIKRDRDSAAHTWIDRATRTYPAPSYTKSKFERIYPILKGIYSQIIRL